MKKNHIIITALVVMIGVAGYLSYIDNRASDKGGFTINSAGEIEGIVGSSVNGLNVDLANTLGEESNSIAVSSNISAISTPAAEQEPETTVFANFSSDSTYFVQAKLNREQARAKEKNVLNEMINNTNIDKSQKNQATDSMINIQQRIEKETSAEALIESKGFAEVYVRINDNSVDVVVNKENLSESEIAQIQDIVKRKTGMKDDQIHISSMRK